MNFVGNICDYVNTQLNKIHNRVSVRFRHFKAEMLFFCLILLDYVGFVFFFLSLYPVFLFHIKNLNEETNCRNLLKTTLYTL